MTWIFFAICGSAWVMSVIFASLVGYKLRDIQNSVNAYHAALKEERQPPKEPVSTSSLIDPTDIRRRAQFEQDELQKRLNAS